MINTNEAFKKFRSKLELNKKEQRDASKRQKDIRSLVSDSFELEDDFLTGSYKRWTKTKPLKDVDIFVVLGEDKTNYRENRPSKILNDLAEVIREEYNSSSVRLQRRSVGVDFEVSDNHDRVLSFDIVPAFATNSHYEIPDTELQTDNWIETDPKKHQELAKQAHQSFDGEWKGLIRMVKKWNEHHGKPVTPSFLIEVMGLDLIQPPFNGDYAYEIKAFFANLSEHLDEEWPDPAGLGPPINDEMNSSEKTQAKQALSAAQEKARKAIDVNRNGSTRKSLRIWKDEIFGPMFPIS